MQYRNFIIILAAICILLKIEGNYFDITNLYNSCFMDRNDVNFVHVYHLGFNVLILAKMLIALLFILVSYLNPKIAIMQSIFMVIWYSLSNLFVQYFKIWLEDTTCGKGKPNSISGHYSFFVFYILTFPFLFNTFPILFNSRKRTFTFEAMKNFIKELRFFESLISILYIIFNIIAIFVVFETWKYGYHSHNQILNGILVGLASHSICSIILNTHLNNPSSKILIFSIVIKIIAYVLLNLILGYIPVSIRKMI